jgi:hypothetical protein
MRRFVRPDTHTQVLALPLSAHTDKAQAHGQPVGPEVVEGNIPAKVFPYGSLLLLVFIALSSSFLSFHYCFSMSQK